MTKKHQKINKHKNLIKKDYFEGSAVTKEELAKLKEDYRAGKLKFNSREVAKAILEDKGCRKGLTK